MGSFDTQSLQEWLEERWLAEHVGRKAISESPKVYVPRCSHSLDPFELSDGTVLYASGLWDREDLEDWEEPDLAIYLDEGWHPRTVAFHIGWRDYRLPSLPLWKVLGIAHTAVREARNGSTVEVGCIGSHGRTGTFLALCELIAQGNRPSSRLAIERVRTGHCSKAIENREQERYVRSASGWLRNKANRESL